MQCHDRPIIEFGVRARARRCTSLVAGVEKWRSPPSRTTAVCLPRPSFAASWASAPTTAGILFALGILLLPQIWGAEQPDFLSVAARRNRGGTLLMEAAMVLVSSGNKEVDSCCAEKARMCPHLRHLPLSIAYGGGPNVSRQLLLLATDAGGADRPPVAPLPHRQHPRQQSTACANTRTRSGPLQRNVARERRHDRHAVALRSLRSLRPNQKCAVFNCQVCAVFSCH